MDIRFKAISVGAYFDEDTVYDREELEFGLFDVRGEEGEIFFVEITYGNTPYICACYKDSVEVLDKRVVGILNKER